MTNHPTKILIAGYYGFGNTGDEAILTAIIQALREEERGAHIIVVSGDVEVTYAAQEVEAVLWTDIGSIVNATISADLVILGGGGIFHDYWGFDPTTILTQHHSGLAYFSGIALLATLLDKPLMICAVGVGPLLSELGVRYTRFACDQAATITVRDAESKIHLENLGVSSDDIHLTADPAFLIQPAKLDKALQEKLSMSAPLVCVALRNWDIGVSSAYWEGQVAEALDIFIEQEGAKLIFLPFQTLAENNLTDDVIVSERIMLKMKHRDRVVDIDSELTPAEKLSVISQSDLVLGMRMHSLLFSITAGVPMVALAYDPKVRNTMRQVDLEEYTVRLGEITAQSLHSLLTKAFKNRAELVDHLQTRRGKLVQLAKENASFAKKLIHQPRKQKSRQTSTSDEILKHILLSSVRTITKQQKKIEGDEDKIIELLSMIESQRAESDLTIQNLQAALAVQEQEQLELQSEREDLVKAHEREQLEFQSAQSRLEDQVEHFRMELYNIQTSRYWNTLSIYWRFRDALSNGYARLRAWLRKLIPVGIRQRVVRVLRRGRLYPAKPTVTWETRSKTHSEPQPFLESKHYFDVICFPIIDWDFRYQRPQHLMTQFAIDGVRCFYARTTFHQDGVFTKRRNIAKLIDEIQLPGSDDLNIYTGKFSEKMLVHMADALEALRQDMGITNAICLVQLPFWSPLAAELKNRWGWRILYDCMDEHAGFSTNAEVMLQQEISLLKISDLVLASSQLLYEKCVRQAKNVLLLPNAADFDHFANAPEEDPLLSLGGPIIGYFGAISEWFDVEMVRAAAADRSDWQFVLIGDTYGADVAPLLSLGNVHLLGEKPYTELPAYLHRFDVACIPFRLTSLTMATNPVKFFEYLSAGKPVVSVALPELKPFEEYFYLAEKTSDFISQIEAALTEDTQEMISRRINFAREQTWAHRYSNLKEVLPQIYEKAVIVIANHNNRDYMDMCLDSIFSKTLYPNFSVIVVDNGSPKDVVSLLRDWEKKEARLKVIIEEEKLGFARANNIGIAEAGECGYLILLNSDTVVTRGWLNALIRHLADPEVTLVGPVTNSIGNEARINVDYDNLADMEAFAQRYCLTHQGVSFDIPMLAMYCLAMRKSVQNQIGLLDERFGLGMFEDDDYSMRAHKFGGRIICVEDSFVHHWGGSFYGRLQSEKYKQLFNDNRRKFEEKWGQKWQPHQYRDGVK